MLYIPRDLENHVKSAARHFSAIILTGPRRSGKTTLLQKLFPKASYILLEDPEIIARVKEDPRTFLNEIRLPAILDEIQNVPEILNYARSRMDQNPHRKGLWLFTGSQEAPLMKGITESLAGRAAVFQLLPFSHAETKKATLFQGGYPEVLLHPSQSKTWFRSYIQTYLERDVRQISPVKDLVTFRRFMLLVASRSGQILNKTDLAAPLGVSVPTVTEWLGILEMTSQIMVIPPFYENFGKRLVKSPKIYWSDSGLCRHLLGIESEKILNASLFLGSLFEGFAASELLKHQLNSGGSREVYYFRDEQGLEIDFLVPLGNKRLSLIEAKATGTPKPSMAEPILRLMKSKPSYEMKGCVLYRPPKTAPLTSALCPGVKAVPIDQIATCF